MNLHDWIDELCDVLDIEVEVDEALLLDVAKETAHQVQRVAAPISTFLLGYAAGLADDDEVGIEKLAAKVLALAESWERPAGAPDPDEAAVEVDVPDDSTVDHTGDEADILS